MAATQISLIPPARADAPATMFRVITRMADAPERTRLADNHSACAAIVEAELAGARSGVWVHEPGQPPLRGEDYLDLYAEFLRLEPAPLR